MIEESINKNILTTSGHLSIQVNAFTRSVQAFAIETLHKLC